MLVVDIVGDEFNTLTADNCVLESEFGSLVDIVDVIAVSDDVRFKLLTGTVMKIGKPDFRAYFNTFTCL